MIGSVPTAAAAWNETPAEQTSRDVLKAFSFQANATGLATDRVRVLVLLVVAVVVLCSSSCAVTSPVRVPATMGPPMHTPAKQPGLSDMFVTDTLSSNLVARISQYPPVHGPRSHVGVRNLILGPCLLLHHNAHRVSTSSSLHCQGKDPIHARIVLLFGIV